MPPGSTAVSQAQFDGLGEQMKQGFDELKQMLRSYEERTRSIETREAGCQPIVTARIDAAWRELEEHNTRLTTKNTQINSLEKQVEKIVDMYKGLQRFCVAIGTIFIVSVGGFIWALITHQAMVVFR